MATTLRQGKPASSWARLSRAFLDFVFPPRCVGCGVRGTWLCPECRAGLPTLPAARCLWCGGPVGSRWGGYQGRVYPPGPAPSHLCLACQQAGLALDGLCSRYSFEGVLRKAVHQFKYRGARHLAEPLGGLLLETLEASAPPADALVPVPLHPTRLARRGYNQSALLAREVALAAGLPVVDGPLRRVRPTESQMSLPAARRRANVRGAFAVVGGDLAGRRVLLIDDVCTTGSTLEACATALKAAGCAEVWGLTLARAR